MHSFRPDFRPSTYEGGAMVIGDLVGILVVAATVLGGGTGPVEVVVVALVGVV